MTAQEFCYWLQGFFELHGNVETLTPAQVTTIENHLNLVDITTHGIKAVVSNNVDSTVTLRC